MTAALLINGVDASTLGLTLAEAPGWLDMPPRDVPTSPIIGRGGLKPLADPVEGARQISLTSTTRSATATLTRTQIDNIKLALLANPLSLVFADHSDRHVYATLKSFGVRALQGASGPFVQEALSVEAVLTAFDPLSYDNALTTITLNGSVNRLSLGTGVMRPLLTISGASVNPIFTLLNKAGVTLASLSLTLATAGGDTLLVDMDSKTIRKNGVSVLSAISAGDFFSVDPADQANFGTPFPYITSSSGSGTTAYYRTWR